MKIKEVTLSRKSARFAEVTNWENTTVKFVDQFGRVTAVLDFIIAEDHVKVPTYSTLYGPTDYYVENYMRVIKEEEMQAIFAQFQTRLKRAVKAETSVKVPLNQVAPESAPIEATTEPVYVKGQHEKFATILKVISARVPVALVGPAGSGKTTAVSNVAKELKLAFYAKSVSAQTGQHEFFGYMDANGKYVRTLFREAFEFGGVFLLDEFDAGNPNVLAAINQAVANESAAFADGMVDKHEDFVVVMAGNTFGSGANQDYVGRNQIDKATLDRFSFIKFDYDERFELSISSNKSWTRKVQKIRKEVAKKKIRAIVSPRASINGAKLLSAGLPESEVIEMLIVKGMNQDEINLIKHAF